MVKRTGGAWFYQEESDAYTHIVRPVNNPNMIVVHCGQDSTGQSEANARFIALAPELLEALERSNRELSKVIKAHNAFLDDEDFHDYQTVNENMLLITKAKGE